MGRPTKLTPEVHQRIVLSLKAGNYRETAAADAGVDSKTLRNWMKRGARGGATNEGYRAFAADVLQAEAEAEQRDVLCITKAVNR